jgi:hypothetical protein
MIMSKYTIELRRRLQSGDPIETTRAWFFECLANDLSMWANITLLEQEFLNGSQEALGVWLSGNSQTARQIRWIQKCLK